MSHVPRMRHRSKVQVEFFAMTKLNRACPASVSVDRRNCHEFGSVERFFNFLIPINLIHIFMITDELHSVPTNIARRAPREQRRYCMSAFGRGLEPWANSLVRFGSEADMRSAKSMSALPPKADMCGATSGVALGQKRTSDHLRPFRK